MGFNWPMVFLRLGVLLLALGLLPALAAQWLFAGEGRILTGLLLVSVAPLGAGMLALAAILFLAGWYRRR